MNYKLVDLISVVKDARPIFVISINCKFFDIFTLCEVAIADDLLLREIISLRIKSVAGKPTYIINLGGVKL